MNIPDCQEHIYIYTHEGSAHHSVYHYHENDCPFCEIARLTEEVKKLHDDNEYLILTLEEIIKHQELMAGPWLSKHSVVIFLAQRALDKIRGKE